MKVVEIVTMSEFHVTCVYPSNKEKKKIVKLPNKGQSPIIRKQFELPADGKYRILLFNKKFDDWVDVDKWQDLPDGGKLKIIVESSMLFCLMYAVLITNIAKYHKNIFLSYFLSGPV